MVRPLCRLIGSNKAQPVERKKELENWRTGV